MYMYIIYLFILTWSGCVTQADFKILLPRAGTTGVNHQVQEDDAQMYLFPSCFAFV